MIISENAKKFYGDGLIYGGQPVLIESKPVELTKAVSFKEINPIKKIAKFSWSDEDAKVKIYIELD